MFKGLNGGLASTQSDLKSFDPNIFLCEGASKEEKAFRGLIIAFAIIFNDLRDLLLIHERHKAAKPQEDITPEHGDHSGFGVHVERLIFGVYTELLVLIKQSAKQIKSASFNGLLKQVQRGVRRHWSDVVRFSQNEKYMSYLENIRGNISYHYYNVGGMYAGYKEWFVDMPKTKYNERGYYSSSRDLDCARFYFADAAVKGYLDKFTKAFAAEHRLPKSVSVLEGINSINVSLKFIVEGYIRSRC